MPSHTLDANPDKCAVCTGPAGRHLKPEAFADAHTAAQDAAIARAVRAAAGSENPVRWLLRYVAVNEPLAPDWNKIVAALRRELEGKP